MATSKHDLVVIGAGPGGYVAAIRAAQLGLNVACVEQEPALGGTCLRVGCIPSKALLESTELYQESKTRLADHGIKCGSVELDLPAMLRRKERVVTTLTKGVEGLFKKNKVTRYSGRGSIAEPKRVLVQSGNDATILEAQHILIATGSKASALPGVSPDGNRIGTSTEALSYSDIPSRLVVIGAGYIGLELGSVWRRLGSEVVVLEYLPRILPGMDTEWAAEAQKLFQKQGIEFRLNAKVTSVQVAGDYCLVQCEGMESVRADKVLLAVGRSPNTEGLGLEAAGVQLDAKGRVLVNERFMTNVEGIYAIGDVIGGAMLAHKAEEEGIACIEWITRSFGHVNYDAIPAVVYTEPEIASVGKTEDQLSAANVSYRKGVFPFLANGRARALNKTEGKVKILADAKTDRILGVHIIGPRAGDLIAEAAVAMSFGASSEDIARTSHAHPTLAEVLKEAALAVDSRAIHI
ncbi:MAG: dihydrolipoyl dehydrogenase [Verrucomicrobiota bacterium]